MQNLLSKNFKKIVKCRLCKSSSLNEIYDFQSIPIGNDLRASRKSSLNAKKYPLKLMNCKKCNHFQLSVSINPKILFARNYTYLTGVTKTFNQHFEAYSNWVVKKCKLKRSSFILEIGSNDGSCLKFFKKKKMNVLGIDPAITPTEIARSKGIETINSFFNKENAKKIVKKYGNPDFITSHNVLAHIENIDETFLSIFKILNYGGFFCFEVGYLKEVIRNNYFDTIYHEHLDYHHATPLIKFLEKIGFSIIDISTNKIQGGSLRILTRKQHKKERSYKIDNFIKKETAFFKKKKILNNFIFFNKQIKILNNSVMKIYKKKQAICAYGSPTKASLLLTNSKLFKNKIKYTFEDNIYKCNKYIPGTDIKIIHSSYLKKKYTKNIIILAWNFFDEIKNKIKKIGIKNINLIIPLPKLKIIRL